MLDVTIYCAPDNGSGIVPRAVLQDLYKDAQRDASENVLKGAFQVALKLHLFMQLSLHKSIPNNSRKDEIEEVGYTALEDGSKISFYGALKTA